MQKHPAFGLFMVVVAGAISCARGFTITFLQDLSPRADAYIDETDFRALTAAMRCQIKETGANITLKAYGPVSQTQCSQYQYAMNMEYSIDPASTTVTSSSAQTLRLLPLVDGSFSSIFAQSDVFLDKKALIDGAWVWLPAANDLC